MIQMLSIEVDGHLRGGPAPRPWVARITGTCPRYGLAREFVKPLNDWKNARVACSGNTYGVVANFPLRVGELYEVSRLRGRPSKRREVREFVSVAPDGFVEVTPEAALARAHGFDDVSSREQLRIPEDRNDPARVDDVTDGAPARLGWVVLGAERLYLLRPGRTYTVTHDGGTRRVIVPMVAA